MLRPTIFPRMAGRRKVVYEDILIVTGTCMAVVRLMATGRHRMKLMVLVMAIAITTTACQKSGDSIASPGAQHARPMRSTSMTQAQALSQLRVGMTQQELGRIVERHPDWPQDSAAAVDVSLYVFSNGNVWVTWSDRFTSEGRTILQLSATQPDAR